MDQRVNLNCLVKLGKPATEVHAMLKEAYGTECVQRAQVFQWFKMSMKRREMTKDDPRL